MTRCFPFIISRLGVAKQFIENRTWTIKKVFIIFLTIWNKTKIKFPLTNHYMSATANSAAVRAKHLRSTACVEIHFSICRSVLNTQKGLSMTS